jgi:hypothetical protein
MAVSDLPCDPNDINAWSTVTVKLERETNSVILEDLDHYGTSPERDYAPTDVVNLNFTFSIYDIRNPEAEIDRHIVQVYEAMRNLGFRMPDVGGPSRIDFANPRGEVIDFDLVPILPLGKLQKLTQRGDDELLVQLLAETPWYQDVIGNIYVSPSKISNYDAQLVIAIDQEVDIRVFEERRITVTPVQIDRQKYSPEKGFFVDGPFSAGTTPQSVILDAFGAGPFNMRLKGDDARAMVDVVNQGIDSYLEGITDSSFSGGPKDLECTVSRKDILVVFRRLWEMGDQGDDAAWQLRSIILEELGIEEI